MEHCRCHPKIPERKHTNATYFGYPVENFWLMPQGTNVELIIKAMNQIIIENRLLNNSETSFSGSPKDCVGLPYMELLIPDGTGTYYVYSSTNADSYLYTTDSSNLILENPGIITNPFRFYMWNCTIFNLAVEPTEEFPTEKQFRYKNSSEITQKMELKATTIPGTGAAYTTSTVNRNTIYVYYPSSVLYSIVDTNEKKIYVMQTGNNQKTGTMPLTPENMVYNQQLIQSSLPEGLLFLTNQIGNEDTVLVVSSPASPATLLQDSMGNSYQLADREYANILYKAVFG